ncbi:MAG: site-specific DNA-methyltransferase [Gammaproteobacteria bacterium]|nr:site-specific DNA-methyltransferase [Gammaproteobacteria bacterium]
MNSESVDLIATDPPFNKGRDFHATPDSLAKGAKFQDRWSWERDVHEEWVDQLTDDHPNLIDAINSARNAHSDGMGAYMCFMAVRLLEMHRVLKPTGSIYLHCDPTASHYLKAVMDAVFRSKQFRNEIIWFYKTGGTSNRWFARKHDNVFFYSKSQTHIFNVQKEKSYLSHKYGFSNIKLFEDERGTYRHVGVRDVWDIPALRGNQPETAGFPTQKPLALYERMIQASSDRGGGSS